MNIAQIEKNLQTLITAFDKNTFIFDLLLAYGVPKSTVTRLQKGDLNLSKNYGEIVWKKKLFFKVVTKEEVLDVFKVLRNDIKARKHEPRFIIVTDFELLFAIDTKTNESLEIQLLEIVKHYDFFLPWAGMEKTQYQSENPADVKAAERMAKLYDEIKKNNTTKTQKEVHSLNVFLSRLLFCFFAEDTGILKKGQFTNAIASHTQDDGNDLDSYLNTLFQVLNTEERANLPAFLAAFPYVNGGLFRDSFPIPVFTRRSRQLIIECGQEDWSAINPDIFGSMIQAVITPEHRGGLGMHYTSVPNIMKVIEPLFLNDLYEEFEAAKYQPVRLNRLLERLSKIRIFDPACGSGNFLIIAYKELRIFEIKVLKQLKELQSVATGFEEKQLSLIPKTQQTLAANFQLSLFSRIELSQFYGIELDDFAHEIAILSLWLAEHQMNMKFKELMGESAPSLPLKKGGNIIHGNATRLNWEKVLPSEQDVELYLLGNPPYRGGSKQDQEQKDDMEFVFKGIKGYKNLDYIACWFYKAANFIENKRAQFAFVSTNSICQGEQVALLWPHVFKKGIEIYFAFRPFKWSNNAKSNAGVTCVIIGARNKSKQPKHIFWENRKQQVENINPYLTSGANVIITKRATPLSKLPTMDYGTKTVDGGNLILSREEKDDLISKNPNSSKFIKKFIGADEYINGVERYCIWITHETLDEALKINSIKERVDKVKRMRLSSKKQATIERAAYPYEFGEIRYVKSNSTIIVPRVSSERRKYLPFGFLNDDYIISDSAQAIYGAGAWILGIISSRMHNVWIRAVCGSLESRIRYSSALGYNNFPLPELSNKQKELISQQLFIILEEREKYSEKTLSQIYDTDKMPISLIEAHKDLDLVVEQCYRNKPFESDEERLEYLLKLYEAMITAENN